jgi:hypothetical protein
LTDARIPRGWEFRREFLQIAADSGAILCCFAL